MRADLAFDESQTHFVLARVANQNVVERRHGLGGRPEFWHGNDERSPAESLTGVGQNTC